ncbi:MAG: Hpt domain-containing protein [Bacteroidota bacterium]
MKTNLNYLKDMSGNDPELMAEMIDIFKDQVVELLEEMQKMLENGDYPSLGKVAHKAKTSVAIMGMDELADDMKKLELHCREAKNVNNYQEFIDNFKNDTQEAILELKEFRNKLS